METDSPVVYHGTSESRFPQKEMPKHFQELSKEEKEVFRECNRESLYYRCLPFAFVGMAATHMAVRKGILTSHPLWGSSLKMTGAAFLGWVIGKFSYRKVCEEKFLALENSAIGDVIRKTRGISSDSYHTDTRSKMGDEDLGFKGASYSNQSDDYHSSTGSLNLDTDKNIQYSGLDDRERPSTDREILPETEDIEPTPKSTTYDDLRKRNRDEFASSQRSYAPRLDQTNQSPTQQPWSNDSSNPPRRYNADSEEGGSKNKYGDNWDNPKFL